MEAEGYTEVATTLIVLDVAPVSVFALAVKLKDVAVDT